MRKRKLLIGVLLLVAGVAVVGLLLRKQAYRFPYDKPGLSEADALALSRQALTASGLDARSLRPVPFWHDSDRLFAHPQGNIARGYTLWRLTGSRFEWDYMVYLTLRDGEVVCDVDRAD